jgi:hypothetical protein
MAAFVRDSKDWLKKYTPREWIRAALGELRRAEQAYARRNARGGLAGARRAAGMALNAALIAEPNARWGRTYVEHLAALKGEAGVPEAVRAASKLLYDAIVPGGNVVVLRSKDQDARVLEAARDVIAHAYAVVARYEVREGEERGPHA